MKKFFTKVVGRNISEQTKTAFTRINTLIDYKHFDEALIEARKLRDSEDLTPWERELAKAKIVKTLGMIHETKEYPNISVSK